MRDAIRDRGYDPDEFGEALLGLEGDYEPGADPKQYANQVVDELTADELEQDLRTTADTERLLHNYGQGEHRLDLPSDWADASASRLPTPRINLDQVVGRGDDEGGSGEAWAWQVEEATGWARSALEYDDPSGVRSRVVDVKVGMTEYDPDDPGSGEDAGLQIRGAFLLTDRSDPRATDWRTHVGSWTIKIGYDVDTEEWTAVVDGIHLDEEARGQGIAGRWVRRLEQVLRDTTDVGEIALWDQSGGFWEAMGYQNDGGHWHTFKRLRE